MNKFGHNPFKKSLGDRLLPVFVVGVVVVTFLIVFGVFTARCVGIVTGSGGVDKATAEKGARTYAQNLGLPTQGVDCAGLDTDGDGYVSCTIAVKQPSGAVELQSVECAATFTLNTGCRIPKIRTLVKNQ